jgi:hypothetical protein
METPHTCEVEVNSCSRNSERGKVARLGQFIPCMKLVATCGKHVLRNQVELYVWHS